MIYFKNYSDCRYTCNPCKFEIPTLRFPRKFPVIPFSTSKYGNRGTNLVQKCNSFSQSELTLLKRQQDFSISAFQWGGVECKIKNMHHHFHCACIQVVANDHRNTIVTHTLIMKRTPHYVKVEKYQKVFQMAVPYSNSQWKNKLD